jgi:CheY-like chemotaxis protein/HPt (histidine-containing phosphotransfer) domain-containing protein
VSVRAALLDRSAAGETVRFSVTDTGIGISKEAQARLFQPYVQAEAGTTRNFGGTGLGLTICRRLADMMGGEIAMQSEPGKGTTMTLTLSLPVADPAQLPKGDAADKAAELVAGRRRAPGVEAACADGSLVLIVEDHPTNRTLLQRLLALLGYASQSAEHGREALEMWRGGRFAAVVTDCNMPEMDGYQLAQAIRAAESGGRRTPIIACTANAGADEGRRCIEAGMDDFLAKPVELEALAKAMERWLPLPHGNAPLDQGSLAEVSGGDAALEREILSDFRSAADADMAALRDALARRDLARATQTAHRVKGACLTIGAKALAEVCARIERAARAGSWTGVAAEREALEREFERLSAWLVTA